MPKVSTLPQYIVNAIRRRARAAEQYNLADERITEYCTRLGLDTEFINRHAETLSNCYDPLFFIHDLEKCLEKKAQEKARKE